MYIRMMKYDILEILLKIKSNLIEETNKRNEDIKNKNRILLSKLYNRLYRYTLFRNKKEWSLDNFIDCFYNRSLVPKYYSDFKKMPVEIFEVIHIRDSTKLTECIKFIKAIEMNCSNEILIPIGTLEYLGII